MRNMQEWLEALHGIANFSTLSLGKDGSNRVVGNNSSGLKLAIHRSGASGAKKGQNGQEGGGTHDEGYEPG